MPGIKGDSRNKGTAGLAPIICVLLEKSFFISYMEVPHGSLHDPATTLDMSVVYVVRTVVRISSDLDPANIL